MEKNYTFVVSHFIVVFVFVYFCLDGSGRFVRVYDPSYLAHIIEINLYTTLTRKDLLS